MLSPEDNGPVQTKRAAPIVLASKNDGSLRFCVDYRKLNILTRRDSYLILPTNECIESLDETTVFSFLGANSGNWQMEIEEENKDKTELNSHHGLYHFVRMQLGLKIAPETLEETMEGILASVKWRHALVYLDDMVIFSKRPEKHMKHVRQVSFFSNALVSH